MMYIVHTCRPCYDPQLQPHRQPADFGWLFTADLVWLHIELFMDELYVHACIQLFIDSKTVKFLWFLMKYQTAVVDEQLLLYIKSIYSIALSLCRYKMLISTQSLQNLKNLWEET